MKIQISEQIELESKRCWECGRYWAHEVGFQKGAPSCPFCAGEKVEAAGAKMKQLVRSNTSIRAAYHRK